MLRIAFLINHQCRKEVHVMKTLFKSIFLLSACLLLAVSLVSAGEEDNPECKDHPLLTRMPGFYLDDCEEFEFDAFKLKNEKGEKITVEGHKYKMYYYLKEGAKRPSQLQIVRNYQNAIKKIGGTLLFTDSYNANSYMKAKSGNKVIWVGLEQDNWQGSGYYLTILEEEAMVQDVVANAASMAQDIKNTGHVALYGIYFDFDKAEVKPESDPTLKEIAKLLQLDAALNLYVVGHTDNIGEFTYNMNLSKARADAVVKKLISDYGVSATRLKSHGIGPLAPVGSNKTEEGRALNRRVELVEQ
jgi:outer membrane protein OmpA-like peptidoglycan-associated protein